MSADNGIYIHEFENGWKVCHAQAIENIFWEADESGYNQNELKTYFEESSLYKTEDDAMKEAVKLSKEYEWTEYGIRFI